MTETLLPNQNILIEKDEKYYYCYRVGEFQFTTEISKDEYLKLLNEGKRASK